MIKINLTKSGFQRKEYYLGICIDTMGLVHALEIAYKRSSVPVIAHEHNIFT